MVGKHDLLHDLVRAALTIRELNVQSLHTNSSR
jgi:hypothetical protein